MAKTKSKYPTKADIIRALTPKEKPKGHQQYILILEFHKMNSKLGIITGELLQDGKIVGRGKMTELPMTNEDSFDWDKLKISESYFQGFSLESKPESLVQTIISGSKNALKAGRIPYIR